MRYFILIIYLLFTIKISGQNNKVGITSEFNFESNALNLDFINSLLYGGNINEETKVKWINLSQEENKIHTLFQNEFYFKRKIKNNNLGFKISDVNTLDISFSKDLLKLVLNGNFEYQNQTVIFNQTHIRANRYQKYNLQYELNLNQKSLLLGVSYLKGNHNINLNIYEGSLYTANYGEYIDINYNINGFITDTSNISLFNNNGNGLAVDLALQFDYKEYEVNLYLEDLGFIKWNKNSISLAADSTFTYNGINVDNIFDYNDSIFNNSITNENYINNQKESYISNIATNIGFSVKGESRNTNFNYFIFGLNSRWQPYTYKREKSLKIITDGFKQSNYKTLLYLSSEINNKYCKILPQISYGGYSEDFNLGLAIKFESKISLILGTKHLEDFLNKDDRKSISLFINIFKIL